MLCLLLVLFVFSTTLFSQTISVSGVVKDVNGEMLPGVNVVEKEMSNGTLTDVNGKFTLTVSGANSILSISFIGFTTKELRVGQNRFFTIELSEDTQLIDEVVVVGYAVQKKATVAAAVSSVNNSDLIRSTSTTTAGALVGKVSGIAARQESGTPGSATTIQIRNIGTPLYVIDGIMKDESAFNSLDMHDIENISILKDGAAAIYGVKAANGVILVTTKTEKKTRKYR
ncbi:MAG: TonB-dependent receptor plug domain-containing protein [Bacteroides sp.]|nr:TonB-dependent receptor plug domain-containing protein [Bacteroides sp.]